MRATDAFAQRLTEIVVAAAVAAQVDDEAARVGAFEEREDLARQHLECLALDVVHVVETEEARPVVERADVVATARRLRPVFPRRRAALERLQECRGRKCTGRPAMGPCSVARPFDGERADQFGHGQSADRIHSATQQRRCIVASRDDPGAVVEYAQSQRQGEPEGPVRELGRDARAESGEEMTARPHAATPSL